MLQGSISEQETTAQTICFWECHQNMTRHRNCLVTTGIFDQMILSKSHPKKNLLYSQPPYHFILHIQP